MSQHSSLRSGRRAKQHRSVLKRYERLQALQAKEAWKEGESVFGLPKVKTLRIKLKKEKAAEAPVAEGAAATTPAGGTTAAKAPVAAKTAPAAKGTPAKETAAPKKEAKKEK